MSNKSFNENPVEKIELTTEEVQKRVGQINKLLKRCFDIENLSVIEGVTLRKITEEVMKSDKEASLEKYKALESGDRKKAEAISWNMPGRGMEVVWRWLDEMYGINQTNTTTELIDDEFKEYIRRLRDKAHVI